MHEGMTDLLYLLSSLKDPSGKILVEGLMDDVSPVTPEEEALYDAIDFDVEAYKVSAILIKSCKFRSIILNLEEKNVRLHRMKSASEIFPTNLHMMTKNPYLWLDGDILHSVCMGYPELIVAQVSRQLSLPKLEENFQSDSFLIKPQIKCMQL